MEELKSSPVVDGVGLTLDRARHLVASGHPVRWRALRLIAAACEADGRKLEAAAYGLRAVSLAQKDPHADVDRAIRLLREIGREADARAAELFFRARDQVEQVEEYYGQAAGRCALPKPDFEQIADVRTRSRYPVAIIVSLYKSAGRVKAFLSRVSKQTLFQAGDAEIIFIDSASPEDEFRILKRFGETTANVVVARTRKRETIQMAWNRGLSLARSDYCCFLGADEGLVANGLERLYGMAREYPDMDWVQARAVDLNLDEDENVLSKGELYRKNYHPALMLIHSAYLSYVGALIKMTAFEKVGCFDPSFEVAGDTDFKFRMLRKCRSMVFEEILGLNFHDGSQRMSVHPRAEVEDYRAWFLRRGRQPILDILGFDSEYTGLSEAERFFKLGRLAMAFRVNREPDPLRTDIRFAHQCFRAAADCGLKDPECAALLEITARWLALRAELALCEVDDIHRPETSIHGILKELKEIYEQHRIPVYGLDHLDYIWQVLWP